MIALAWFAAGVVVGVVIAVVLVLAWLLHKVNVWEG